MRTLTPLTLPGNATAALHAVPLQQVTSLLADAAAGAICVDPGSFTYDATDPGHVGVTITSVWGIDSGGNAYYDDANVTAGEEAALFWNPLTGVYQLVAYDFP